MNGSTKTGSALPDIDGRAALGRPPAGRDFVGNVSQIGDKVVDGVWFGETQPGGIALGVDLAADLEVGLGDEVVAVGQAADGSTANELFIVVALLDTGSVALDF